MISQVWCKFLSETNIISGFRTTGIFPTKSDKYNIKRFDQRLYNHYQHCIEIGRPEDFYAENETNSEIDNEQLNEEIEEKNLDNLATSPRFVENE